MRSCNNRFELRLPQEEKDAAEAIAQQKGITMSEHIRRALRAYANIVEPLSEEGRIAVAGLRRRVNQIEARLAVGEDVGLDAEIKQARVDAKALLRR